MFEVIYMKADFEPWWMFEEWREKVKEGKQFDEREEARAYFQTLYNRLSDEHSYKEQRKNCFFAFWTETERVYCEGCDESIQLFHGIILLKDGEPAAIFQSK